MDDDMAWVRFTADHDFRPAGGGTVAYRAGMRCSVTRACSDGALALGSAEEIPVPSIADAATLKDNPFATISTDEAADDHSGARQLDAQGDVDTAPAAPVAEGGQ